MMATVASESWARTGNAQKAIETLELFNPEEPELSEIRAQMWLEQDHFQFFEWLYRGQQ